MMTIHYPSSWIARAQASLTRLADNPWALFIVLLSVNTLWQPYAGITHDTRLYSVQVLNRVEEGTYANDLFFRYGSQDEYSLFSRLAGPLVRWLGLPTSFFVIYLLSKTLLLWAMIRIVQTLVPDRMAGVLALVYCMAVSIHYGGHHILNLQENFVTPRMPACALVLLGLDLLLRGRPVFSVLVIFLALIIHPLMAFGGLLVWSAFHLWKFAGLKWFLAVTAGLLVLVVLVLAIEPLGSAIFGPMDDDWRQTILYANSFNFPSEWVQQDWRYLAFQLTILGFAIGKFWASDAEKARFLIVLGLATLAGTVGAVLAERLPYALLLQGQAYRALWMLAFLHLVLTFWLCLDWLRQPSLLSQLAGCGLLAYLCCTDGLTHEYVLPVLFFPLLAVALRGLDPEPRSPAWLAQSFQLSLVLGGLGWVAYKWILLMRGYDELLLKNPEQRDIVEIFLINTGPIALILGLCWLLVLFADARWQRPVCYGLTAACLGVQTLCFALPETDFYREHCTRYRGDLRLVRDILHRERAPGRPLPTVYCNLGCLDYIWLDLRSQSYFDWWQAGNFMFRREMALEGQRRACLVAPFELARMGKVEHQMSEGSKAVIARFFKTEFQCRPVTTQELARLCQEPNLDYLVLEQNVEGLQAIKAGQLYVYSCREARASLKLAEPGPGPLSSSTIAVNKRN